MMPATPPHTERAPIVEVTRTYRFSAAHRMHNPRLSAGENRRLYGRCNHASGHGHTYRLAVTIRGPIADLNTALGSLRYFGDANFNTATLPERLGVQVNDLGNTDVLTPPGNVDPGVATALTSAATVTTDWVPRGSPS